MYISLISVPVSVYFSLSPPTNHSVSDEESLLLIFGTLNVTFPPIAH